MERRAPLEALQRAVIVLEHRQLKALQQILLAASHSGRSDLVETGARRSIDPVDQLAARSVVSGERSADELEISRALLGHDYGRSSAITVPKMAPSNGGRRSDWIFGQRHSW